jgi:hypothetical protein
MSLDCLDCLGRHTYTNKLPFLNNNPKSQQLLVLFSHHCLAEELKFSHEYQDAYGI